MKLFTYIWRNIIRNKLRNSLTVLSVGFSLALMTVLYGYNAMQSLWGDSAVQYNRIVVMSSQGFAGLMPESTLGNVEKVDGVIAAVPYSWFGGTYKEQQMAFAQFGTDPQKVFEVWDEYKIDPEQLKEFQSDRTACVADRRLAERMEWKIGEDIPLAGTFYDVTLNLKLVGVYDAPQNTDSLLFQWKYMDELVRAKMGDAASNTGTIFAKTAPTANTAEIMKAIDDRFASSDTPTRTQTEQAFAQMFAEMVGNVKALIFYIGAAVVFSLTLIAATAMAMSMRERTTEIAVLKAIGFSKQRVLVMVLGEACLIALIGGLLGFGMGCLFLQGLHTAAPQFFPFSIIAMVGSWMLYMLFTAAGIGVVSGLVPAYRASNLSVIDGLRRVI